jgi:hypothetical protein
MLSSDNVKLSVVLGLSPDFSALSKVGCCAGDVSCLELKPIILREQGLTYQVEEGHRWVNDERVREVI